MVKVRLCQAEKNQAEHQWKLNVDQEEEGQLLPDGRILFRIFHDVMIFFLLFALSYTFPLVCLRLIVVLVFFKNAEQDVK